MRFIYKVILILVLSVGTINATLTKEDKNANILEELKNLKIENQLLKQKVDFLNKNFEVRLKMQNDNLQKNLNYTLSNFEILREKQNKNHLNELDNQFWIFGLFSAIISIIAFLMSWLGINYIKRKIKKTIEKNHKIETEKLVNKLAESSAFINIIKAQLDVESMEQLDEDGNEEQYEE